MRWTAAVSTIVAVACYQDVHLGGDAGVADARRGDGTRADGARAPDAPTAGPEPCFATQFPSAGASVLSGWTPFGSGTTMVSDGVQLSVGSGAPTTTVGVKTAMTYELRVVDTDIGFVAAEGDASAGLTLTTTAGQIAIRAIGDATAVFVDEGGNPTLVASNPNAPRNLRIDLTVNANGLHADTSFTDVSSGSHDLGSFLVQNSDSAATISLDVTEGEAGVMETAEFSNLDATCAP